MRWLWGGEPHRLGVTAIKQTLQSVEGRKITGREPWRWCSPSYSKGPALWSHHIRGAQHPGLVGRPQGGAARDRVTLIISCAVGAQPQGCSYKGWWVLLSAAPSGHPGTLTLASGWPVPLLIPVPQCSSGSRQPAVQTLTRKMLRGFLYSSHTDELLPKFGSKH